MAALPAAGAPPLMVNDPPSAKNAATLAASWLHHAAVYLAPNSCSVPSFIGNSPPEPPVTR
jgi:hypothetical protein